MSASPHERLRSRDGTELAWHHWPLHGPRLGSVLLVHGVGEHLQRYPHVAQALLEAGFEVGGIDLRGHGLSAGFSSSATLLRGGAFTLSVCTMPRLLLIF